MIKKLNCFIIGLLVFLLIAACGKVVSEKDMVVNYWKGLVYLKKANKTNEIENYKDEYLKKIGKTGEEFQVIHDKFESDADVQAVRKEFLKNQL